MNGIDRWLAVNGIVLPTGAVLIEAAVALGLALACLAAGYAVGRLLGPRTAQFWTRRIGGHVEGLGPRMGVIIRYLTRSEEHTSELQSLMRISYAVFCFKK